ncbi:hypothetical protein BJY52DRAFT_281377 [Lactarius psammicola]|nr:hypothetical protein BJY52DRAFT_281377 [Lactarius psammicola]
MVMALVMVTSSLVVPGPSTLVMLNGSLNEVFQVKHQNQQPKDLCRAPNVVSSSESKRGSNLMVVPVLFYGSHIRDRTVPYTYDNYDTKKLGKRPLKRSTAQTDEVGHSLRSLTMLRNRTLCEREGGVNRDSDDTLVCRRVL